MNKLFIFLIITFSFSKEWIKINSFENNITFNKTKYSFERDSIYLKTKPFLIHKYETTNNDVCKYFKATKNKLSKVYCQKDIANLPAVNLSYKTAKKYCKFIGARLPTEEEWIVAASVSQKDNKIFDTKKNHFYFYPTKNYPLTKKVMNYYHLESDEIDSMDLVEVNQTIPSFNGIYGLIGNVYEMTSSTYENKDFIIIKGGSFLEYNKLDFLKTTFEDSIKKDSISYSQVGFRCVKDIK